MCHCNVCVKRTCPNAVDRLGCTTYRATPRVDLLIHISNLSFTCGYVGADATSFPPFTLATAHPRLLPSSSYHHIYLFIYQVTSYHKKKTATSSRSITKASKYAIPLKPNTQTCRVKAIFSHLVRRQRRTERSSKSTATSPS